MDDVRLLSEPFAPAAEIAAFSYRYPAAGGIVSFIGKVRGGDDVEALELSHYAPLTLPGMADLATAARGRWAVEGVLILHRVGEMRPGDPIVLVAAASRHRRDAFAAADYIMDHLKAQSWFWKREKRAGQWAWVEPRAVDHADLARWD
ncbi:molybdenum cofactor biosynthesis protein MoaE [Novosphingobium sp. FSY-8]|uniref:Molybdopterin synthase catalytic subunit n=1 Tax=Novosphingobium ovatum TaxID=1908523 RepID=A0ABW9XD85_9SPHN|nr:molybdenum cofactor biosynthesis protein MoaE [Novosphingobium ovatum]NBC36485.1 molybdenum cofactor biosynthesis protein MoaE [Novosphingobium ovatum]